MSQDTPDTAALREALRIGAVGTARDLFVDGLARSRTELWFTAWVARCVACFSTDRGAAAAWVADARQDRVAATLLFARVAFGSGCRAEAFALAREAVRTLPSDRPEPSFLLCAMLLVAGDPQAQSLLTRCRTEFPQPSRHWSDLGDVLLGLGKTDAALVCLAWGIPSFDLFMRRGLIAKDRRRLEEAADCFRQAVRLNRRSPRAWFQLGTCAQDLRDLDAAAGAYRAVLALDPRLAEAAVNLGTVLQEAGDLDGAKIAYAQAVATRADTFGRVAQALATSPKGELWLDLGALRRNLAG